MSASAVFKSSFTITFVAHALYKRLRIRGLGFIHFFTAYPTVADMQNIGFRGVDDNIKICFFNHRFA